MNAVIKGQEGAEERDGESERETEGEKKIIFHSPSQHDPDNSRLPFLVRAKLALCPKLHELKRNKKPYEKRCFKG